MEPTTPFAVPNFGVPVPLASSIEEPGKEQEPGKKQEPGKGFESLLQRFEHYRADMEQTPPTVTTGFSTIDTHLKFNGFTVLGGAPRSGKTSLCLNIALNRAKLGLDTVFYSLEMPVFNLINRLVCNVCTTDFVTARTMWKAFKDTPGIMEAMQHIYFVGGKDMVTGDLPTFDTSEKSDLVTTIKRIKAERGQEPGQPTEQEPGKEPAPLDLLIIIDSLHLLPSTNGDLRAATNENVAKIRTLTDTYHLNTIVIGQSKRTEKPLDTIVDIWDKKKGVHDTTLLMGQLRESSMIEFAVDCLYYILNDSRPPSSIDTKIKWLCAVKNRITDTDNNNPHTITGFDFKGCNYRFIDTGEQYANELTERRREDEAPKDNTQTTDNTQTASSTPETTKPKTKSKTKKLIV